MSNPKPIQALAFLLVPAALILSPLAFAIGANTQNATPKSVTASAHAEQGSHECFLSQLNLSKEQSQKVQAIMQDGRKQGSALRKQLHTQRHALMQYLKSPNATQAQALSMNTEINTLQRQMGELRLKTFFAMRAQLTPEQLQKLQHLQKNRMEHSDHPGCWHHGESPDKGESTKKVNEPAHPAKPGDKKP